VTFRSNLVLVEPIRQVTCAHDIVPKEKEVYY